VRLPSQTLVRNRKETFKMQVSQAKWYDALVYLTSVGTAAPALTAQEQNMLRRLQVEGRPLTLEQAQWALKEIGWSYDATHPNKCLIGTQQEWETSVFRNANHFTVFRYGPGRLPSERRNVTVYQTFTEALEDAADDLRALIYAVTIEGRAVCIPRKEWPHYLELWSSVS
jgi:hypothetical protein